MDRDEKLEKNLDDSVIEDAIEHVSRNENILQDSFKCLKEKRKCIQGKTNQPDVDSRCLTKKMKVT